jgi:hypothetical protein
MQIYQKTKTFLLRVNSDTDYHKDDITDAIFTHWIENTICWPTVPVFHTFTGGSSMLQLTESLHTNKHPSPLSVLTTRKGRQTLPLS